FMNHVMGKNYNTSQMLEAIDANVLQFYKPATWGYNMFYYIAASNDCHPNYVAYLMNKRTLSVSSVSEVLKRIPTESKLLYDKSLIEKLYADYQLKEVNDEKNRKKLKDIFCGKEIMLVGPGASIRTYEKQIKEYVCAHNPLIVSINQIPKYLKPDYIFLSNSKRYVQLSSRLLKGKFNIIATSNVTGTGEKAFKFVINFGSLIDRNTDIIDNSLVMFLKLLINFGINNVSLVGFDGYSEEDSNYYNLDMEYDFVKSKAEYLNGYVKDFLNSVKDKLTVKFVTKSKYCEKQ
ncbi:MAG: 3-hydroxy-3-methylglutaryl-CoA lyase, partial [Clostridia bacterium]|nr:3-hydroxy-3-methylglutaryl-CoA lyase [Clostridia bacterium]